MVDEKIEMKRQSSRILKTGVIAFAAVACSLFLSRPASAAVVINEVGFNSTDDWVELYNNGAGDVSVDGWTLDDNQSTTITSSITIHLSTPIPSGGYLVVYVDAAGTDDTDFTDNVGSLYSGTASTLDLNTEDNLSLYSSSSESSITILDHVSWDTVAPFLDVLQSSSAVDAGIWSDGTAVSISGGSNDSIGLIVNGVDNNSTSDWKRFVTPSPGTSNGTGAAGVTYIRINEIMYDAAGSGTDWFEIYNTSTSAIDITGWTVFDGDGTTWHSLTAVQGTLSIAAGGYVVIADNAATFLLNYASDPNVGNWTVIDSGGASLSSTASDTIAIRDASAVVNSSVTYNVAAPWPLHTEGNSIARVSVTGTDSDPANWGLGPLNGTPGALNSGTTISEVCNNLVDDDADGKVDCNDSDCSTSSFCGTVSTNTVTQKSIEVDDSRNPFSPYDTDANFSSGLIYFNVQNPAVVKTIRIVNVRGETVRMLINNDIGPGNTSVAGAIGGGVQWDGRDDSGNVLPVGIYIVFLDAVDPSTGERITGKDTIVLGRPF